MEYTGERLLTSDYNETTIEHLHRYGFALQYVGHKKVVDIASGEGYGSNILASVAETVIGVDIDKEVIDHAQSKYRRDNLHYKMGSADKIPVNDKEIDVVVSFETIEHHERHHEMLKEIKRILKDDGILIMSSPDKFFYSDLPKYKNPFHIKELYLEEFKKLISEYFSHHAYYYQKLGYNSLIISEENYMGFFEFNGSFEEIARNSLISNPLYNIVIASEYPITNNFSSSFAADELLKNKIYLIQKKEQDCHKYYRNSYPYKIGKLILSPLYYLKALFKK